MQSDPVIITCPGCGLTLPFWGLDLPEKCNATGECLDRYFEMTCRTLVWGDSGFIHQHAVDAYAAQHSSGRMPPITTAFALMGLYLALEREYTGRQVQFAHVKIGKKKSDWPRLAPRNTPVS